MTFDKLQQLFISLTNTDEVEPTTLALWFNEAQLDLALDFGEVKDASLPGLLTLQDSANLVIKDEPLPEDLLRILDVQDGNGNSVDWEITPQGRIAVSGSGSCTLYYRAMPSVSFDGMTMDTESALPAPLHYLLAFYAAWKFWDMESEGDTEESNHATKFLNYYRNGKADMLAKLDFPGSSNSMVKQWMIL